jgi:diguanylate cyclase (GGDEF)-like protein
VVPVPKSRVDAPDSARDPERVESTAESSVEPAEIESGGTPASVGAPGPRERTLLRRVRRTVFGLLAILAVLLALSLLRAPGDLLVLLELACVIAIGTGIWTQLTLSRRLADRRAAHEAGITRMLQGMSRSVSSDAIVQAILDELRGTANADHVAVARLRPVDHVVEATLVSSRARVPASRTTLPASVLDPARLPAGHRLALADDDSEQIAERAVAHEIARRLADAYALANTLAVPLVSEDRILGALILSRRQRRPWTAADRRLLSWASAELSAALARAFAFEEAENQANVDALTGLPNRRYLEELLSSAAPRRRSGDRIGALMIDLDRFKQLNDRYGHATGDRVLRAVGEQISNAVRADDTPARYGGEEFAVVLRRATRDQAVEVAERIRAQIAEIPPSEMGIDDRITVSVGIAVGDARATNVAALLIAADSALYTAKRQGRNRVVMAA